MKREAPPRRGKDTDGARHLTPRELQAANGGDKRKQSLYFPE